RYFLENSYPALKTDLAPVAIVPRKGKRATDIAHKSQPTECGGPMQSSMKVMTLFVFCLLCGGCNKSFPATPVAATGSTVPAVSPTPVLPSAPASPSGPTGTYTVTLTASTSCAVVTDSVSGHPLPFPDVVRVRSYEGQFADGVATLTALDG